MVGSHLITTSVVGFVMMIVSPVVGQSFPSDHLSDLSWVNRSEQLLATDQLLAFSNGELSGLAYSDTIVFTAHQGWLSRIYLLRGDGSVINFYEYEFYYWADLEVVNGEVYAAEAFAPRVYKIDLATGGLEVVVDDWSLYYFYGLAFDGTYFYLDEWDMNRYLFDGSKDGVASLDETVYGCAWDDSYLWTLGDENVVKCWDISGWPSITEVSANNFLPPSAACRGLWFDGEYFWSTEAIDEQLGQIYKFDHFGNVIAQLTAPGYIGWSVCVLPGENHPPEIPSDPYPADNVQNVPIDTQLGWDCIDLDGDQLTFDIYLGTTQPLPKIATGYTQTYFNLLEFLDESTTYQWYVVAYDFHPDTTVGPCWSFTTYSAVICGDADSNDLVEVSDAVFLINYVFVPGSPAPDPYESGDADCSGVVEISDAVYIINYIFVPDSPAPCDPDGDGEPDC